MQDFAVPIVDLHCDLLSYLAFIPGSSACDEKARCSFPQLQEGGVSLQTMAVFVETGKGSYERGQKQIAAYKNLSSYGFSSISTPFAIENASMLLEEEEELELAFQRLDTLQKEVGTPVYISLTWNTENRFAGGNYSDAGLKPDGKALLEYLDGKEIAIDLSHTSDKTAEGIFETIDKKGLRITPIASHSNFREVQKHVRNLPDHFAKEIVKRKGVIGLNLVRGFVGENYEHGLIKMVEHADQLGALDVLCFGADFFYDELSLPSIYSLIPYFIAPYDTSRCYPKILSLLRAHFPEEVLKNISYKNASKLVQQR